MVMLSHHTQTTWGKIKKKKKKLKKNEAKEDIQKLT